MEIISTEEYKIKQEECTAVMMQIDHLLKSKQYEKVCQMLDENRVFKLSLINRNLHILEIMKNIQRQECTSQVREVFAGRNVAQICELYQNLVRFLRRIEFDLPKTYQREILEYLDKEEISWVCVLGVVYGNPYILDEKGTVDRFYQLLQENGK